MFMAIVLYLGLSACLIMAHDSLPEPQTYYLPSPLLSNTVVRKGTNNFTINNAVIHVAHFILFL
jgi:hypothetical protein